MVRSSILFHLAIVEFELNALTRSPPARTHALVLTLSNTAATDVATDACIINYTDTRVLIYFWVPNVLITQSLSRFFKISLHLINSFINSFYHSPVSPLTLLSCYLPSLPHSLTPLISMWCMWSNHLHTTTTTTTISCSPMRTLIG